MRETRTTGFALIETLIALVLVMIGLTGALRLQAGLLTASSAAKAGDEALALARAKLAELTHINSYQTYAELSSGTVTTTGQLHRYRLTWTLTHHPSADYKILQIRVDWPAEGHDKQLTLAAILAGLDLPRLADQQLQL